MRMSNFFNSSCFPIPSKVFLLVMVLLVSSNIRNVRGWRPRHFPKIGISEFAMQDEDDSYHHAWETDIEKLPEGAVTLTDNGQTYIVSQPIMALTLDCNASYPVQWNFLDAEEASENVYSVRIRMIRTAKDVYNPLTNSFTSQLQLYGDTNSITGEYACFSTEYQDVQKKIYIYWLGGSPTPLIPQDHTRDLCVQPDNTVILPCRVANPDLKPSLYFEEKCNENFRAVSPSPFIKYDTKVGYTIDLNQYDGAFGRYKCSMSDDDSYPAIFNLKNETCRPRVFNNTISNGASFRFNKKEQKVICCSNSSKAPSLQGIFCFDPVSCKMRQFRLHKNGNNGLPYKTSNCVYEKIYEKDSGVMRCNGDGIDVTKPFYTDLQSTKNDSFSLYFDWNELHPEKLIAINVGPKRPMYDKQNISISCEISYFYFAEGVKWAVRWKNGSLLFLDSDGYESSDRAASTFQAIKLALNKNMSEVLCFAPVWNTTEWVNKTYQLDIKESTMPKFDDHSEETITLNLNETGHAITCQASGSPTPSLRWRKNNRTVLNENNYALKRKNNSLIMVIHRVSHDTQGEFRCVANNIAGRVERVVNIYVIDPGQPLSTSAILFVVMLLIILLGGVGFLIWRMQLQRKIITHLTGIVFRDMSGTSGNSNGNANSVNRQHVPTHPISNGNVNAQVLESNHI